MQKIVIILITIFPLLAQAQNQILSNKRLLKISKILQNFNLPNMTIIYNEKELEKQNKLKPCKINFYNALNIAIKNYLNNNDDIESPLVLFIDDNYLTNKNLSDIKKYAKNLLKDFLNRPSTTVELISTATKDIIFFPFNFKNLIQENWIFSLHIADYSDHIFFAFIDRAAKRSTYIIGFN